MARGTVSQAQNVPPSLAIDQEQGRRLRNASRTGLHPEDRHCRKTLFVKEIRKFDRAESLPQRRERPSKKTGRIAREDDQGVFPAHAAYVFVGGSPALKPLRLAGENSLQLFARITARRQH